MNGLLTYYNVLDDHSMLLPLMKHAGHAVQRSFHYIHVGLEIIAWIQLSLRVVYYYSAAPMPRSYLDQW